MEHENSFDSEADEPMYEASWSDEPLLAPDPPADESLHRTETT